ncbi:MAG TPA: formate dehydrogenase subunit gamma [Stellaceae bacterium]|nr:formate dehydrogenase subunit gamma [Stellaceae bacterium]
MGRPRPWNADEAADIIASHRDMPGAALPILHALQDAFGYVDREAVPLIADALNLSRAEIHGIVSFYHDFRDAPPGRRVLRLCRAEACQSMGCDALIRHVEDSQRVTLGETNADRTLTVEAVYCLGNCALAPAVLLDGELHGRVSAASLDRLLGDARRRA